MGFEMEKIRVDFGRVWRLIGGGVLLISLTSCATSPRPLPLNDLQKIVDARRTVSPWRVAASIDNRRVVVVPVLFDGTWNDRAAVKISGRQTIVAHINDKLSHGSEVMAQVQYYEGTGTQGRLLAKFWDGALGSTSAPRAKVACYNTMSQIQDLRLQQPDAELRIFVAGFSRGAASARHFMNLLERGCDARLAPSDPGFRSYAMLFDTVATGQRRNLLLGIPASVDHVMHFVSLDERRIFFRVDQDVSDSNGRIRVIPLPGVHSDVGDAYLEGLGGEVRHYVDMILLRMGLIDSTSPILNSDFSLQGGNDSRWLLEKMLRIGAAGSAGDRERGRNWVESPQLTDDRRAEWWTRQEALGNTDPLRIYGRTDMLRPVFDIQRTAGMYRVVPAGYKSEFDPDGRLVASEHYLNPEIIIQGGRFVLTYRVHRGSVHEFVLPRAIERKIRRQAVTRLEIGVVARSSGNSFTWIVDDRLAGEVLGGVL